LKYCNERFFYYLVKILKFQNLKPVIKNTKSNGKKDNQLFFINSEGKPSLVLINNNKKNYFLNLSNYSNDSVLFYLRKYKAKKEIENLIVRLTERRKKTK
ncbi:MAG: hypothetical protein ACPL1F_04530, partial [bacterium]